MPKGIPLTETEQANRRREIFNAAVNLFLEKGFQETSMRAIAAAAGMGKSSLYDYFTTKDEILVFVIEEESSILTKRAQVIASQNSAPELRLQQIMEMHVGFMQENKNLFSRLSAESQRLKPESQRGIHQRRYEYQDLVAAVIQEGIAAGSFRTLDALHAARLLINSLLSVLYTTRPTSSTETMLDQTIEIFLRGIIK